MRAKIAFESDSRVVKAETVPELVGPSLSWISCRKTRSGVRR